MLRFFTLILSLSLLQSCAGKRMKSLSKANVAYLYQLDGQVVEPQFYVHHENDSMLRVYYAFKSDDLLFMRSDEDNVLKANITFTYQLIKSFENTSILDSGRVDIGEIRRKNQRISGHFTVQTQALSYAENKTALLLISMRDNNRNYENVFFENVESVHPGYRNNWLIKKGSQVLMTPFVRTDDSISVRHREKDKNNALVDYFRGDYPLALPPFSMKESSEAQFHPDSTFTIDISKPLRFEKAGIYHIRYNAEETHGFSLFVMDSYFPYVGQKNDLVGPIRYITTRNEYQKITQSEDPDSVKMEIEKFWLTRGRSVERGKTLIKAFYSRVEKTNALFSSYKEGWKTDRGLIYTIFGPPNVVYPSTGGEKWVYGEENSHLQYVFHFARRKNPFSDNDYELVRDESYRYGWGLAIESWRNGKVYTIKEIKREQDERDQQIRLQQRPYFWY